MRSSRSQLIVALTAILMFGSGEAALAQSSYTREDQLQELKSEMASMTGNVVATLQEADGALQALLNESPNEQQASINKTLNELEGQANTVLDSISLNSRFMDSLDDAKARIIVVIKQNENEPPSAARDNRLARLQTALDGFNSEYTSIQATEGNLKGIITQFAKVRREVMLEGQVDDVENVVSRLQALTRELTGVTDVLKKVSSTVINNPESTATAQD